jgi:NADH:ubiquinone oxidoreductase subunit F (NADH-binding)
MAGCSKPRFGITLNELIHDIGGGTASGRPVQVAVQVGGPLGAYIPPGPVSICRSIMKPIAVADALDRARRHHRV